MKVTIIELVHTNDMPHEEMLAALNVVIQKTFTQPPLSFNARIIGRYDLKRQDI